MLGTWSNHSGEYIKCMTACMCVVGNFKLGSFPSFFHLLKQNVSLFSEMFTCNRSQFYSFICRMCVEQLFVGSGWECHQTHGTQLLTLIVRWRSCWFWFSSLTFKNKDPFGGESKLSWLPQSSASAHCIFVYVKPLWDLTVSSTLSRFSACRDHFFFFSWTFTFRTGIIWVNITDSTLALPFFSATHTP